MESNKNIVWHEMKISQRDREDKLGQKGLLVWLTGLSGSGKSTIASLLEVKLHQIGKVTYLLDGDNVRHGLSGDLGFSADDRVENIRRISEVGKLFVDAGVVTIASFISPFRADREKIRALLGERFVEVFVDCDLSVCEERDPKGLYQKVRAGEIKNFTGVDSPYEIPLKAEVVIRTDEWSPEVCVETILEVIEAYPYGT